MSLPISFRVRRGRDRMVVGFTTKVARSNPVHGEVYSIQHYVIKFVSDVRQVCDLLLVSSTKKTDRHDITEILLKVALHTTSQSNQPISFINIENNIAISFANKE